MRNNEELKEEISALRKENEIMVRACNDTMIFNQSLRHSVEVAQKVLVDIGNGCCDADTAHKKARICLASLSTLSKKEMK